MSKSHLSQAGNKISGTLNNHGFSVNGSNFQISGGSVFFGDRGESKEEECRRALFLTNPLDDRGAISTSKPRLVARVCQWIHDHAHFKSWKDDDTNSKLLWISGGSGMGKTMLSLFLLRELEATPEYSQNSIILFYFCDGHNDKRNTAVSILRGLIFLLLKARPGLINILLADYDTQKEALFSQTSLEALWRIFETMIKDPTAGRVFCLIDGLDECKEDSLLQLLRKLTNFYEDEKERQELHRSRNLNPAFQPRDTILKMILVSREAPKCLPEALAQFLRVQVGVAAKKEAKPVIKKVPKLSSIAREAMRQRTLDRNTNATTLSIAAPGAKPEPGQELHLVSTQPMLIQPPPPHLMPAKSISTTEAELAQLTPTVPALTPAPSAVDPSVPASVELTTESKAFTAEPSQTEYVFDEVLEQEEEETIGDTSGEEIGQNQSLVLYIEEKVADLLAERAYPEPLRSSMTAGLQNRGDGTFLWVDLAIEEVKKYESQHVEKVLEHLPPSVNEMYCRTLQRVPPQLVGLVVAILRWVVSARRPLFLEELAVALGLMNFNAFDIIDITRQGIAACDTMMKVQEDSAVQITHTSVKDLLIAKSGLLWDNPGLSRFHVNVEEVDGEIASLCLHYLEQGCLKDGPVSPMDNPDRFRQRATQYALLPYAAQFWPDHLRSASRPQINLSSTFFIRKSDIRKNWWLTYYPATTGKAKLLAPRDFNTLHMAAYLNIPCIANQLLQRGELRSRLDNRDSHGATPLSYAAEMGNMAMFVFLLQQGAKQDGLGESIFELAVRKGQGEIAEYLLDLGHNINAPAREVTVIEAMGMATRWLPGVLNEGVQLDSDKWKLLIRDIGERGTALHSACLFGHVSVVEMLLRRNANVHAATTKQWTALHGAAWTGQIECVKILLEKGANAFETTEFGWMPFHCAASRGKTSVVRLFLELGMPVDTLTTKQKSSLHLAAYSGHAATVRLLQEHGAALDAQSHKGETALHLATRNTKPEVVQHLLSLGANKLIINKNGFTAADTIKSKDTCTMEQKEILRILETFGMPGYVPWQPKQDPKEVAAAAAVQPPNQGTTGQNEDTQRASATSGFSSFKPVPPTASPHNAQSQSQPAFQANIRFAVQTPTYAPGNPGFQDPTYFQGELSQPQLDTSISATQQTLILLRRHTHLLQLFK
ncbi:MAG: hypothetical protein M1839_006036 [Geoglossum umbratile]|nr:MAG: hypothetical protein M1839_006036 [Geoglossum umbratile]